MTSAKPQNDTTRICIRAKDDTVSWEELTELLHDAYARHLANGLNFGAATQTPEQIRAHADRICGISADTIVAFDNDELIGTISYSIRNSSKWFYGRRHLYFYHFGVRADYKNKGVGSKLLSYVEEIAKAENCDTVSFDTAESARDLIQWYQNRGYVRTVFVSWANTNFNSIIFTKAFNNKGQFRRKFHFLLSKLLFPLRQVIRPIR